MVHQLPAFIYSGYRTIEIDIFTGVKVGTIRSEDILKPGGPAELVNAVIAALGLEEKPVVAGYDHGASIALRMAAQWPTKFSKVVAFHPGIADPKAAKPELSKIKCPVLIQWVPADMFHPWSKWKAVVPCIPSVTVELVKIHPWSAACAKESYKKVSNQVCLPIVKFLTGTDPVGQAMAVHKAKDV